MNEEKMGEALAGYADGLTGRPKAMEEVDLTEREREQIAPLFQLSERLHQSMQPVRPSPAFAGSLKNELVEEAQNRMTTNKRVRRGVMIGAAIVGSIASLIGAVVILVKWLRTRTQTRHAPTG